MKPETSPGQSRPALQCGPTSAGLTLTSRKGGHRSAGLILTLGLMMVSCSRADPDTVRLPESAVRRGEDPPVMINAQTPVEYPPTLFARGIEGKVLLRLYADETGGLTAESTHVAESSGYPALDSAALAAVASFKFAPAMKNGAPVAGTFLQPVHFRHPQAGGTTP